jgi:competence ComEA-like helix-hairpin-helix protein
MREFIQRLKEIMEISRFQIVGMLMLSLFIFGWTLIRLNVFFKPLPVEIDQALLDSLLVEIESKQQNNKWDNRNYYQQNNYDYQKQRNNKFFDEISRPFDPNTASLEEMIAIGVSEKVANNIVNYRKMGTKFNNIEDLRKLYTLSESYFYHLKPFIKIQNIKVKSRGKSLQNDGTKIIKINLNTANLDELTSVKGIGEATANKLIKYRNLLGGFSSMAQIEEVYGLWDKVKPAIYENLMVSEKDIQKRNLKSISVEELAKHPYLSWNESKAIVNFLKQHPNTNEFTELEKIHILDSEKIKKILPYFLLEM